MSVVDRLLINQLRYENLNITLTKILKKSESRKVK